ncbi:DUF4180 domain-containing protein [Micromonospora matsumotoense]|uniref:DUF4180 domain-containing protein n=1 Tax=Micromonospora matsumotoense TaxID=121616 RepID=UPI0033CE62F8
MGPPLHHELVAQENRVRIAAVPPRLAGEVVQKFVNYRLRLAVVGDISGHVTRSTALRDFVVEADRGRQLRFVDTLAELEERLRVEALRQDAGGR